jgi:hypothetical protein
LEAARLAYMTGKATEDQVALVEEANERAIQGGFKLPSILGAPTQIESAGARSDNATGSDVQSVPTTGSTTATPTPTPNKSSGWAGGWLWSQKPEEKPGSDSIRTASLQDQAKAAYDTERANQQKGGPLDQLGLEAEKETGKRKGWW